MQFVKSSLQVKVVLIILGIFVSIGLLDLFIKQRTIYPSFMALELNEAKNNLERCRFAIDREIYHLDNLCHDWASWTDTYNYAKTRDQDYQKNNLLDDTLDKIKINLLAIYGTDNRLVWKKISGPAHEDQVELEILGADTLSPGHMLLDFDRTDALKNWAVTGVVNTRYGPLLLSSRPILTTNQEGPPAGTILMGRFLSKEVIASLKSQIRVDFQILLPGINGKSDTFQALSDAIAQSRGYLVRPSDKVLTMFALYNDISLNPAFIIETDFPRKITASGLKAIRSSMILMTCCTVIVLLILLFLVRILIVKPIYTLTEFTSYVTENSDFSFQLKFDRSDEIGLLAKGIRAMMATIVKSADLLIQANLKLQHSSATDGLTGIPNRRTFDETFRRDWHTHRREEKPLGLIMCDIDFFKSYNDTYGHQQGDHCLKTVAKTIKASMRRAGDLAARYGGEEFVIILPNTDHGGTLEVAETIRNDIEAGQIAHQGSTAADHVTLSLGAGSVIPSKKISPEAFIEKVDQALYQAKESGRNQVCGLV